MPKSNKEWVFTVIGILAIALSIAALYSNAINTPYIFDSLPIPNKGFRNYIQTFSIQRERWLPLTTISYIQFNFKNPVPIQKIVNIVIHIINSGLLFLFFKQIFSLILTPKNQSSSLRISIYALVAALLFALNPVATYAVAYVIQRTMLLGTMFGILGLISFTHGFAKKKPFWIYMAVFCYFLTMQCKQHFILFPSAFILIALVFEKPSLQLIKKISIPLILCGLIAINVIILQSGLIGKAYEPLAANMALTANVPGKKINMTTPDGLYFIAIVNQCYMYFKYLLYWLIPVNTWMSVNMAFPFPKSVLTFPHFLFTFAFMLNIILGLRFLRKGKEWTLLGFAMLYPCALFFVEFSVIRFHEHFVLYRSYLWATCFFGFIPFIFKKVPLKAIVAIIIPVLIYYSHVTTQRIQTFESLLKIWQDAVQKIDYSKRDQYTLAIYRNFTNVAAYYSKSKQFHKAIDHYQLAVNIYPTHPMSLRALGHLQLKNGQHDIAFQNISKAIKNDPKYATAYYNLGNYYSKLDEYQKAIEQYLLALKYQPVYATAYYNIGNMYSKQNKQKEAVSNFKKSIKQDPNARDTTYNLGNSYFKMGDYKNAIQAYKLSIKTDPHHAPVYHNMAVAYTKLKDISSAKEILRKVIKLDPKYKPSQKLLKKLP